MAPGCKIEWNTCRRRVRQRAGLVNYIGTDLTRSKQTVDAATMTEGILAGIDSGNGAYAVMAAEVMDQLFTSAPCNRLQ